MLCLRWSIVALVALLPNIALAGGTEVKPSNDFQGISYSITTSGNVVVFAGVRDISGKVAVCGLVFFEKATSSTMAIEPKFTEKVRFSIAGKGLSVSSRAFKRYKSEAEAFAGNARCAVTTTPWKEAYGKAKLAMKLSAETVYD